MTKELQSLLSVYLGELLNKQESEYDWMAKANIEQKINAVRSLLDIPTGNETGMRAILQKIKT